MAANGCLLGCITVTASGNESIHWTEDPGGGSEAALTATMTVRDYFLDSSIATESITQELASTMDSISLGSGNAWTYTVTNDADTGQITIAASGGDFRLDIAADSDTSWTDFGFGAANVTSSSSSLTATNPPKGTIFWRTCDLAEELAEDTGWLAHWQGAAISTTDGKRHTRTWGEKRTRRVAFRYLAGSSVDWSGATANEKTSTDIDRAQTCYRNHWRYGHRVRLHLDNRTLTGTDHIEATVTNESFEPTRTSPELDWWDLSLDLQEYVS